jgi:hypothetical protein
MVIAMADSAISLEDAIIFIGSLRSEGMGFKEEDKQLADTFLDKAIIGEPFSDKEYKDAYKMLNSDYYKEQLKERIDFSLIPRYPLYAIDDSTKPSIRPINLEDDPEGTIGVDRKSWKVGIVDNLNNKKSLKWISDCAVHIHTETRAKGDTEFTFVGGGAADKRPVKFTMSASDLANTQKFKAALINAFGAENEVGKLNFEMVQRISKNIRHLKRVEVPIWDGSIPLVPGVDLATDVEYRLYKKAPAKVYAGDIEGAKECLRNLLEISKYASILVTAILGSPAYARWYPNDRFGVGLWGLTGSKKTSAMLAALSMFGTGYADKEQLLKSDDQSSTPTACGDIAVASGIMPQSYDNVKTVDDRQLKKYVGFIHNILEGGEKDRSKKDGRVRDTRAYLCTLVITGEVRPQEASTTARVINLTWSDIDLDKLSYVQEHVDLMPIIGYYWLRYLSSVGEMDGFKECRSTKNAEFSKNGYTNPGRLATNYSLIKATWDLLCESPFADVFKEFTEKFNKVLDEAFEEQGSMVTEETEVAKFLRGVKELIASKPELIQGNKNSQDASNQPVGNPKTAYIVGKWDDKGLFVLPDKILVELERMKVFTQKPSEDSMTKALRAIDALVVSNDGKHLQVERRINKMKVRGWLLSPKVISLSPSDGDA